MFVLTWDAGPQGYAALLIWWERDAAWRWILSRRLFVGTWPPGSEAEHQPHREILAARLATECAEQQVDLRGSLILYRNYADAAISAMSKGGFASPVMQRSAVQLNRFLFRLDVLPRFWHVPGLTLVAEGVDGASRGGGALGDACVDRVVGPAVKDELWSRIEAELRQHGCWIYLPRRAMPVASVIAAVRTNRVLRGRMPLPCWIGQGACAQGVGRSMRRWSMLTPRRCWHCMCNKAMQAGRGLYSLCRWR
jgi:hypothetical protein